MTASLASQAGRTIREQELALEFSETGTWSLLGEAAEVRCSEFERAALQVLQEHGPPDARLIRSCDRSQVGNGDRSAWSLAQQESHYEARWEICVPLSRIGP